MISVQGSGSPLLVVSGYSKDAKGNTRLGMHCVEVRHGRAVLRKLCLYKQVFLKIQIEGWFLADDTSACLGRVGRRAETGNYPCPLFHWFVRVVCLVSSGIPWCKQNNKNVFQQHGYSACFLSIYLWKSLVYF